ncbi:MAG: S-methyl-5-thioribose-1-phosphate isomerase [Anaerolineae bacterium]|nr:S-methyl-5-thioribose-1-phosphate isomerase [Thermoflexus sp.]MDW8064581.1 S-methyl-5-thioribose-1-phosphate isomerase [Anaerolineae bacterium]
MRSVEWRNGVLRLIDQRRLPHEQVIIECDTPQAVAEAIRAMAVRGAPAIGAAAAFGMALAALRSPASDPIGLLRDLEAAAALLKAARPTAVNLSWAVDRMLRRAADERDGDLQMLREALVAEAIRIAEEDVETNRRIGQFGAALIRDGDTILHHCNTGALATVDYGTALGVIRTAYEQGKRIHVLVNETRPRLQGARLTAWELLQLGIPFTVIADSAAGYYMRMGRVSIVMVGADRIAANGDVANKVGTYTLSVLAKEHGIPFYVVAPTSTIDPRTPSGDAIPIEERDEREVLEIEGILIAPRGARAANPAFDVTPARYITGIVTERGILYPPFDLHIRRALGLE